MKKFVRFQTDEDAQNGSKVYIDPQSVVALYEEGDDYTNIYTTAPGDCFTVWGNIEDVRDKLDGTLERNREAYG